MRPLRVAFVMEQHLGHRTYSDNLRALLATESRIEPTWIPIDYLTDAGLVEHLPVSEAFRGMMRGRQQVQRGLAACAPDIAFFNTHVPAVLGGALTRRQPYVISTDITPTQYAAMARHYGRAIDRAGLVGWYKRETEQSTLRGAASVVPWSSWTARSLMDDYGLAPSRVDVLPPGVDLSLWSPRASSAASSGPMKILFVGGDFVRKGGEVLLEAFRALPQGSAELHVVTRTPLAEMDGVFPYYGMQPNQRELVELFRAADVFVLPTAAEAFGIVAIEACAMALPIVATSVGGLSDIVTDGENGYLIASGDAAALADRLQRLASAPEERRRMGDAGRARAEARFDARIMASRVVATLFQAAESRA